MSAAEQRRTVYGYDSAGRLVTETISGVSMVVGQGLNSYDYDVAGRLRSWTDPGLVTTTYGWDDAGNRDRVGGVSSVYDARNRITGSSNGDTFAWSARGTLVSQSVAGVSSGFVFDGLGRMVTVDGLGYQYDGLGRVAARSDGAAGWVGFAYSGVGLQPVSDGNGLIARSPGGDPVATKVGSAAAVSVGLNRHGDVTSMFDPVAGTVEGSVEFDPFGVVTGSGGVSAGNIGFQGAYTDPVSKLVDMGARWCSPGMGRFVSRDTIHPLLGTPVSLNMYTYANNDPLGFYDPDGHQSADTCERTGQCSRGDANGTRGTTKPTTTKPKTTSTGGSGLCPGGSRRIDGDYCPPLKPKPPAVTRDVSELVGGVR